MIANYRVQAELSAIDSTYDGKSIVLGTVDGCVSVLAIADPKKPEMKDYLKNLPSRDETASISPPFYSIKKKIFLIKNKQTKKIIPGMKKSWVMFVIFAHIESANSREKKIRV